MSCDTERLMMTSTASETQEKIMTASTDSETQRKTSSSMRSSSSSSPPTSLGGGYHCNTCYMEQGDSSEIFKNEKYLKKHCVEEHPNLFLRECEDMDETKGQTCGWCWQPFNPEILNENLTE